jgi:hypothetical protein
MTDQINSEEPWICEATVAGQNYTVEVSAEQIERAKLIIKPKPKVTDDNKAQVLKDHRDSVRLCGYVIISAMYNAFNRHDKRKLEQTPDEHHAEKHHWTFNPEAAAGIAVWDLAESVADYIATVYGRAMAGRGFDIMHPETRYDAGDVLMASCLSMIDATGIGTVTPKPESLPEEQSEGGNQ